jgi:hypothetical protein
MEALIADQKCSQTLRRHMEGEYLLRYKTLPVGVPAPAPAAFAATKQQLSAPEFRLLRGYAFDPSLSASLDTAAMNEMTLPVRWEDQLKPGPVGEYLEVIDYDSSTRREEQPVNLNHEYVLARSGLDPSEGNPQFHQQMVYAVAMTTIQRFERALGRPTLWAATEPAEAPERSEFTRRLRIYPHAMEQQNAYYSPSLKALLFGYFPATADDPTNQYPGAMTFTCLSHDIVAHETTHAILDGMHRRFGNPTNPDMLAFHEAFADIVALFQHFTFPEVVEAEISKTRSDLTTAHLLADLGRQFGIAAGMRGALRSAIGQKPDPAAYQQTMEPHDRGAILVATVFDAFVAIYNLRTADLLRIASGGTGVLPAGQLPSDLVRRLATEAARAAGQVLDICIRALDYCPPVDLTFGDYLRALVTADYELVSHDPLGYRLAFLEAFRRRGIYPLDVTTLSVESLRWKTADEPGNSAGIRKIVQALRQYAEKCAYVSSRKRLFELTFESRQKMRTTIGEILTGDGHREEVAQVFGLDVSGGASEIEVHSLRMAQRLKPDGAPIAQAIMEVTQSRRLPLDPLNETLGTFEFIGGCTLVIDLKQPNLDYAIVKNINAPRRIQRVRDYLRSANSFGLSAYTEQEPFALLHSGIQR